jgi:hypothetical protein
MRATRCDQAVEQLWNKSSARGVTAPQLDGTRSAPIRRGPADSVVPSGELRRLRRCVPRAELEALDRVEPIAVVPPELYDRDPILPGEPVYVALRDLPSHRELLGGQQLSCGHAGHLIAREPRCLRFLASDAGRWRAFERSAEVRSCDDAMKPRSLHRIASGRQGCAGGDPQL